MRVLRVSPGGAVILTGNPFKVILVNRKFTEELSLSFCKARLYQISAYVVSNPFFPSACLPLILVTAFTFCDPAGDLARSASL